MHDHKAMNNFRKSKHDWEENDLNTHLSQFPETKSRFTTDSGITIERLYTPEDLHSRDHDYLKDISYPGCYPFTRGITPSMYRSQPWTIAEYGGFGSALETNRWFKYMLSHGTSWLGIALDLPTQVGYNSDHPMAKGEVGKIGVAVNSLRDMEIIFDGIPLDTVGSSTTANSIGPIFLALFLATAEKQGIDPNALTIFTQNDVLKEYTARGTQIFPPGPATKFAADVVEYVVNNKLTNVSPIQFCGYHYEEAGANAMQEIAFPIANAEAYCQELTERGITIDDFISRVTWFLACGVDLFEEIAKCRAFRRLWARTAKEDLGTASERSMAARLFTYTAGSGFTAQQPLNNIVRGCIGGLAAVLGGSQYMVISGYDEAVSIPSEEAVRVSLRTQQIIAEESRISYTVDPLAGSYYVETLTTDIEEAARKVLDTIRTHGGAVAAIEDGYIAKEIADTAWEKEKQVQTGDRVKIGVNKYRVDEPVKVKTRKVNPKMEQEQVARLNELKTTRNNRAVAKTLDELKRAAKSGENTVDPIKNAVMEYVTIGEICDVLREIWGTYNPTASRI
jgi:methylmalonyl-CoA mutase N-terminal domain/subunit